MNPSFFGTAAATANTKFYLDHQGTKKALDGNGSSLYMGERNHGDFQQWQFQPVDATYVRLRHCWSKMMLAHADGGLHFRDQQNDDTQLWRLEPFDLTQAGNTMPAWMAGLLQGVAPSFTLINKASGQALDSNGTDVYMHPANGGAFQRWQQSIKTADWLDGVADDLKLPQLCLPGSHDAGMYELDQGLTLSDQAWYFQAAEIITKLDMFTNLWNIFSGKKPELTGAVAMVAKRLGLTQSLTLYGQLEAGSRFFDLRPGYRADTQDFHLLHGKAVGPRLRSVLDDVARFLRDHPRETALLEFSHFDNMGAAEEQKFIDLLTTCIPAGQRLTLPRSTALTTVPLQQLRGKVVVLLDDDGRFGSQLQGTALPGVYRLHESLPVFDQYANAQDYGTMYRNQLTKFNDFGQDATRLDQNKPTLFLLNWTLTPVDNDDLKAATGPSVEEYAAQINGLLTGEVRRNANQLFGPHTPGYRVNILNLDFVERANPVPLCLEIMQRQ